MPRPDIPSAMAIPTPTAMRTSPTLKTLANGTQAGRAKMSVRGRSAGSARTTLLENPSDASIPSAATASGAAGITPPLATMAARFERAPTTTSAMPGSRMLRSTATSTAAVEAT
jgi:hypothetical protein